MIRSLNECVPVRVRVRGFSPKIIGMDAAEPIKQLRVYADTSVFGGVFDVKFKEASALFFDELSKGRLHLVLSALSVQELLAAPERVRTVLDGLAPQHVEIHAVSEEMEALQMAYLSAGVLGPASENDALHVAAATVLNADMIVSWNFKHIVHFEKIRAFNAINRLRGYKAIEIYSPLEVVP